jgi:hypothetical protein
VAQALFLGRAGFSTALESWQGSCFLILIIMTPLDTSGHLPKSEAAVRPRRKARAKAARRPRKATPAARDQDDFPRPAVGTLTRTKTLLLAALKVWELKNGIRD